MRFAQKVLIKNVELYYVEPWPGRKIIPRALKKKHMSLTDLAHEIRSGNKG